MTATPEDAIATSPAATALFGGSFDPPHAGHIAVARAVLRHPTLRIARVVLIPAPRPPHKLATAAAGASIEHRTAMLRLAVGAAGDERLYVSDVELRLAQRDAARPSYTIDTLERLADEQPTWAPRYLVVGADTACTLGSWHRARDLPRQVAAVIAAPRPDEPGSAADPTALFRDLLQSGVIDDTTRQTWLALALTEPKMTVSSSALRRALANGERPGPDAIDPAVLAYINRHLLYGTR